MSNESQEQKDVPVTYRTMQLEERLEHHEVRISSNERFRLMAQGAIAVISFMLGAGALTSILFYVLGVL